VINARIQELKAAQQQQGCATMPAPPEALFPSAFSASGAGSPILTIGLSSPSSARRRGEWARDSDWTDEHERLVLVTASSSPSFSFPSTSVACARTDARRTLSIYPTTQAAELSRCTP
jgi:hypothetical protein